MKCIITLKSNGMVLNATVDEEGLYRFVRADNRITFYTEDKVKNVIMVEEEPEIEVPVVIPTLNAKKGNVVLYHYLIQSDPPAWVQEQEKEKGKKTVLIERFITSTLPPELAADYKKSKDNHRPENNVMAITTGTWKFNMLEWNYVRSGKDFSLRVVANEQLPYFDGDVDEWIDDAVFAYANASYSFFFNVEGTNEWGPHHFDVDLLHSKKAAKRGQELTRLSQMSKFFVDNEMVKWKIHEMSDTMPAEYGDGITFMSRSFAVSVAREIQDLKARAKKIREITSGQFVRGTIRWTDAGGTGKGDVIIVPDKQLGGYDMITHSENIKRELTANGDWLLLTMWEHEVRHIAVWDDQSAVNFNLALPEEKQIADINRLVAIIRESLLKGEIPQFLLLGEDAHNEDGTVNIGRLSDSVNRMWIKWQLNGLDIRALQNLVYMALNGVVNRMKSNETVEYRSNGVTEKFYKKMWIPMTNAISATVITAEAAVIMGGFDFPGRDLNKVFFDRRVGLVIPGVRFVQGFDPHGTWDLDDTVKAIVIKVWASADIEVHRGITIPSQMQIPTKEEDATEALLLVRSPNGPGEYTIERADFVGMFDDERMLALVDFSNVTTVDLAKMPLPQVELLKKTIAHGLDKSTQYTGETMTREDAREMIMAQIKNPGVGPVCNSLISWSAVAPGFPKSMLDVLGNMVDASQQGADELQFEAIAAEPNNIYNQLVTYIEQNPDARMDRATAATRMPVVQMRRIEDRLVTGRHTHVQKAYWQAIGSIEKMTKNASLQWRRETDLIKEMKENHPIPAAIGRWSESFFMEYDSRLSLVTAAFTIPKHADPFTAMNMQYAKKIAMEEVVAQMVAVFESIPVEHNRYLAMLGLYKWIVLMPQNRPSTAATPDLGRMDRIICQAAAEGQKSLMDILIEALSYFDLI